MASGLRFAYEKTLALVGVCVNRIGMEGLIPISQTNGSFTYGGTPLDQSVVQCIQY
jgi:hypothetical protein